MKVRATEENFMKKHVIRNLINIVTVLKALESGSEMLAASSWMLDDSKQNTCLPDSFLCPTWKQWRPINMRREQSSTQLVKQNRKDKKLI